MSRAEKCHGQRFRWGGWIDRQLRRWTVAGPEVSRLSEEFEVDMMICGTKQNLSGLHHDQQPGVQSSFLKDVQSLTATFQEMGNPFMEENNDR